MPKHQTLTVSVITYSLNLLAFLERLAILAHAVVCTSALCLEPHALHLVEVLHRRHTLLQATQKEMVSSDLVLYTSNQFLPTPTHLYTYKDNYCTKNTHSIISTGIVGYSEVLTLIYTAERTEAIWREQNCPNF